MKLLIVPIFIMMTFPLKGQQNMNILENTKAYNIWSVSHVTYTSDGEADELSIDCEFITSLPLSLKKIIAYYSQTIPLYVKGNNYETSLAKALGDFSSLKEAQDSLAKDLYKTHKGDLYIEDQKWVLYLMKTEKEVFFWFNVGTDIWNLSTDADRFKIDPQGKISWIERLYYINIDSQNRIIFAGTDK